MREPLLPALHRSRLVAGLALALIVLATLDLEFPPASAQTGGRTIRLAPVTELPASSKRWALVIGVDTYADEGISPLRGAANDAKTLGEALVRHAGFPADQVIVLATGEARTADGPPTRTNILRRLSNLAAVVPKDGLLLVSFSGHGMERGGQAFLLPSDATAANDVRLLQQTAVSVTDMHDWIKGTGVGQVVVLLDACRNDPAGGRADSVNALTQAYTRGFDFDVANREVEAYATLYATSVGARAYEYVGKRQGYFTWAIVEALKGGAADAEGRVTLSRLVKYVEEVVPKRVAVDYGAGKQPKPFARIEGYRADELVVAVAAKAAPVVAGPAPVTVDPRAVEMELWGAIKESRDPADYEDYLKRYPTGVYEGVARAKIRTLRAAASPSATQPVTQPTSPPATSTAKPQMADKAIDLGGGVLLEMVLLPAGSFDMGSNNGYPDEKPVHRVTITKPFYLGKYEVTQGQWKAVMGTNPSKFTGNDELPVEQVSWEECQEFIRRLNARTGLEFRLPTEAEWEYACQAGASGDYAGNLDQMGWYDKNSNNTTHSVGQKQPNAWGLYDMHGNVWEWCADWYGDTYYNGSPGTDPKGPSGGSVRVNRGGCWGSVASYCRSAYRFWGLLGSRSPILGFRLARTQ
jgi:formylglycine-generating enzyme required for sulfatase activity